MTLAKIAEIAKPIDNEIYDIISKKFYLDDLLLSLPTAEKAINIMPKINNLLRLFNLNTHKWFSNDKKVLESIPPEHRHEGNSFVIKENTPENLSDCPAPLIGRSLGMYWTVEGDDSFITFEHLSLIAEKLKSLKTLSERDISASCGYFF